MGTSRFTAWTLAPGAKTIACLVIASLTLPSSLRASWHANPDPLPGTVSGKSIAIIAAAGGGAIAGLLYLKLRHRHTREAEIAVGPSHVDFGRVPTGGSMGRSFVLRNPSSRLISVQALDVSGPSFSLGKQPVLPLALRPGERVELPVKFGPDKSRDYSGTLEVRAGSGNGKQQIHRISLKGTGL